MRQIPHAVAISALLEGRLPMIGMLAASLEPDKKPEGNIIGAHTGTVQFFRSILRYAPQGSICVLVRDMEEEKTKKDLRRMQENEEGNYAAASVHPYSSIPQLVHSNSLTALHDTMGPYQHRSASIRSQFATRPFPITCTVHGFSQVELLWDFFARLLLTPQLACDSVVCTTQSARQAFASLLDYVSASFEEAGFRGYNRSMRLDVVPLGIDTELLYPRDKSDCRRILGLPQDKTIILSFGRIDSRSKADLFPLLKAFGDLNKKHTGKLALVLAGGVATDYEQTRLEQIARSLDCANQILLRSSPSLTEGPLYYSASDIFVGLSETLQESYGLSPLEAMSSGLPVVVSDWSGYRETVLHGETGFRVNTYWTDCFQSEAALSVLQDWSYDHLRLGQSVATDIEQLTHFLDVLICQPELRRKMGDAGRERVVSYFSSEVCARQYLNLWSDLAQIAQSLPPLQEFKKPLYRPPYFQSYSHFASYCLAGSDQFTITEWGRYALQHDEVLFVHGNIATTLKFSGLHWILRFVKLSNTLKYKANMDTIGNAFCARFKLDVNEYHTHLILM